MHSEAAFKCKECVCVKSDHPLHGWRWGKRCGKRDWLHIYSIQMLVDFISLIAGSFLSLWFHVFPFSNIFLILFLQVPQEPGYLPGV